MKKNGDNVTLNLTNRIMEKIRETEAERKSLRILPAQLAQVEYSKCLLAQCLCGANKFACTNGNGLECFV